MIFKGFSLPVGEVLHTELDGEAVVLVGTAPSGLAAILTPKGWAMLKAWKLNTLLVSHGRVCATGKGYGGRPHVARILTGAPPAATVEHRNGNLFDLRRSNLVVVPRSLKTFALRQQRQPPSDRPSLVVLRDGRVRTRRKPTMPNALQRYAGLVGSTPRPHLHQPPDKQPTTTTDACGSD